MRIWDCFYGLQFCGFEFTGCLGSLSLGLRVLLTCVEFVVFILGWVLLLFLVYNWFVGLL